MFCTFSSFHATQSDIPDRNKNGHRDGDGCAHDRDTAHHNAGDGDDDDRAVSGHSDTDGDNNDPGNGCAVGNSDDNSGARMTGGGTFGDRRSSTTSVKHGFELHCDATVGPNDLEVNWGNGNRFHLEKLETASCTTDPSIQQAPPRAPFNTYAGTGTGLYNGTTRVKATWVLTDAGEPGTKDMATLTLTDSTGKQILFTTGLISKGNQQAHKH